MAEKSISITGNIKPKPQQNVVITLGNCTVTNVYQLLKIIWEKYTILINPYKEIPPSPNNLKYL